MTSDVNVESRSRDEASLDPDGPSQEGSSSVADEERGFLRSGNGRSSHSHFSSGNGTETTQADETELQSRRGSIASDSSAFVKRKTSQFLDAIRGNQHKGNTPLSPQVAALVEAYAASDIAAGIRAEIESISNRDPTHELPNVAEEHRLMRGRRGASWLTQFRILSGRAFKNLYRDPMLLAAHYLSSIALACGLFSPISSCLLTEVVPIHSNLRVLLPTCRVNYPLFSSVLETLKVHANLVYPTAMTLGASRTD